MKRLIASGWWVAVAAVALGALVAALELRSPGAAPPLYGDGSSLASYGFDLTSSLVPRTELVPSGLPRDGLAVLDEPALLSVADVERRNREGRGKFLLDGDRVVGVVVSGDARAYPLRLLRWHEVVNDTVGGVPVVVTYNPLCDAVVVARRPGHGTPVRFGFSGLLYQSNLVLYDRRTDGQPASLYNQLQARAIAGPAAARGEELDVIPVAIASWGWWRSRHPATRVLAPLARLSSQYARDPYSSYFGSDLLRFPVSPLPPPGALRLKDRVLAVRVHGQEAVFALPLLAATTGSDRGSFATSVAGIPITIDFDAAAATAVVIAPEGARRELAVRFACWFAWFATHPGGPPPGPRQ